MSSSKSDNELLRIFDIIYSGDLNKKEIQLNLCNISSILILNEFHLFA